jgi:hypothetical protein
VQVGQSNASIYSKHRNTESDLGDTEQAPSKRF